MEKSVEGAKSLHQRKPSKAEKKEIGQPDVSGQGDTSVKKTAEERPPVEEQKHGIETDLSVHTAQESLLSNASGFNNYRGILNLCVILLVMSGGRLVLENLMKYGILVQPISLTSVLWNDRYSWPNVMLAVCINYFILYSFGIEKLMKKFRLSENLFNFLSMGNLVVLVVFPVVVITVVEPNPVGAGVVLTTYAISMMKLYSYHVVNQWYRQMNAESKKEKKSTEKAPLSSTTLKKEQSEDVKDVVKENGEVLHGSTIPLQAYPQNINLKDIYYFMAVPTLCYELNFPRTESIRKTFLVRRIVELLFLLQLSICLVQQWIVPLVVNAMKPIAEMDITRMVERILKLAVPNHFIWLCFFYFYFHSFLNVLGEIFRFADREFYRDWWNSESIGEFWRNWNIPVHKWARRHVYKPMRRRGFSARSGHMVVFLFSAIFHEYVVSVPLHMFKLWVFAGMIMQIPLATAVSMLSSRHYANMVVQLWMILGQPIAILIYIHDYYVISHMKMIALNGTDTAV